MRVAPAEHIALSVLYASHLFSLTAAPEVTAARFSADSSGLRAARANAAFVASVNTCLRSAIVVSLEGPVNIAPHVI
jgi:hypothetical protein